MSKKIQAIQGLRGVAIILIVLWHLNSLFPLILPPLGDRGVEFFLIISGFLVAAKHLNGNSLNKFSGSMRYSFNKIKMSKIVEMFNKKLYSQRIITWYSLPSMLI